MERVPAYDPWIGRTIEGRYRIESRIAKGGMSTVYRAMQVSLQRIVAVKIAAAEWAARDPAIEERYQREARLAAALRHPNSIQVHDAGNACGSPYLVMELIEGPTLAASVARHGALPPEETVRIGGAIARALGELHQLGFVHRDLKPSNVLMDGDVPKVIDLGLARSIDCCRDLTSPGLLLGSPSSMAPEVIDGDLVDPRTDVYGLGILLFFLATGRRPFRGGVEAILRAHLSERAPVEEGGALAPVIERCLAKRPADRYASMEEVVADLERCTARCEPTAILPRRDRPVARRLAAWALAGTLAGAAIAVAFPYP